MRALFAAAAGIVVIGIAGACTTGFNDDPPYVGVDAGDASLAVPCDPRGVFLSAVPLRTLNTAGVFEGRPALTPDERTIVFERAGVLMQAQRSAMGADFGPAVPALPDLGYPVSSPGITPDAGVLLGSVNLDAGTGLDLWESPVPYASADAIRALDSPADDRGASYRADGAELYFSSSRRGPFASDEDTDSLFVAALNADGGFADPVALTDDTTNSKLAVGFDPAPSADGKTLYFARRQSAGTDHVFVADIGADGVSLTNLAVLAAVDGNVFGNAATNQFPGMISTDNCRLYFASDATGDSDLYVASRR